MGFILSVVFIALLLSSILFLVKRGKFAVWAKEFRWLAVLFGIGVFSYWFFESSVTRYLRNSLSAQIINKLPQSLDFYLITIARQPGETDHTRHIGKIRPEYYRVEYMKMQNSGEFWVVGYLGKNMVYFSQHSVPNKNIDQIVEINNYIIQSEKLAARAKAKVSHKHESEISLGIWITLVLLLLFLNIVLLFRKK